MKSAAAIFGVCLTVAFLAAAFRSDRIPVEVADESPALAVDQSSKPSVAKSPKAAVPVAVQPAKTGISRAIASIPPRAAGVAAVSKLSDIAAPSYVEEARHHGANRIRSGADDYLFLPNVEVVEIGVGDEAEEKIEELKEEGREVFGTQSGVAFVRRDSTNGSGEMPIAAYNERTGKLVVITGTYKVMTEVPGSGRDLQASFSHMSLIAEFANLKLSLLQSRAADRLLKDLDALRKSPGVVSADLEILENEVKGI